MLVAKIKTLQRGEQSKFIWRKGAKSFKFEGKDYFIKSNAVFRRSFLGLFGYNSIDYVQDNSDPIDYFSDVGISDAVAKSPQGISDVIKAWNLAASKKMLLWMVYGIVVSIVLSAVSLALNYFNSNPGG